MRESLVTRKCDEWLEREKCI